MKKNVQDYFDFSNDDFLMITSNINNQSNINMFLDKINLDINKLCKVKQTHSNKVIFIDKAGNYEDADGLLTSINNKLILSISTADCIPIFLFDKLSGVYGLVHAGWKGVVKNIHLNAIDKFCHHGSKIENINIFLGPFIKKCCFEIRDDIIENFDKKYIIIKSNKKYIDLLNLVIDGFINTGLNKNNIKYSSICTYDDDECYSYRRSSTSERMHSIMISK